MSDRTFRRYIDRYEEGSLQGLIDHRLGQVLHRRAPVDEVLRLTTQYTERHAGWNVKHFHDHGVRHDAFIWGYTWAKNALHAAGVVDRAKRRHAEGVLQH